jgi:GNAT superfamily N-acetyltransferase
MSLTLHPARPEDADAIAALFSRSFRLLTFLPELHTVEEDRWFIGNVVMTEQRVTVAERDGAIIGFIAETDGWLHHLYVAAGALRSGVGSLLLADAQGRQERLDLWCFRENARARWFYEKHGFVAAEFTDGGGNEARLADVRYRWTATPA